MKMYEAFIDYFIVQAFGILYALSGNKTSQRGKLFSNFKESSLWVNIGETTEK